MTNPDNLVIHTLELGPMENFIYLLEDPFTSRTAVVDPAWDVSQINAAAKAKNLQITDVLLTHCHHDHINGVEELLQTHDANIHLLKDEAEFWGVNYIKPVLHHGGDVIRLGKSEIKVMHTPGHSVGSACYHSGHQLITGDTMFVFGCGHCKLAGGDPETLYKTLTKMKTELAGDTIIYPGHHYAHQATSTMQEQCEGNPFLHFDNKYDFIKYRVQVHDKTRHDPYDPMSVEETQQVLAEND